MDFDFALVLVALTFVSGFVWFYDRISLKADSVTKKLRAASERRLKVAYPMKRLRRLNRVSRLGRYGRSMFPVLVHSAGITLFPG